MTTPVTPVPAAWYPDPAGSPRQRWWDGTQWTEHYSEPLPAQPIASLPYVAQPYGAQPAATLKAPEGTSAYNGFVYGIIGLLVLGNITVAPLFDPGYFASVTESAVSGAPNGYELFNVLTTLITWLFFALSVVLAFFDWRSLRDSGVQRPFHWAFAFLGAPLYLIGRGVVTRSRTGSGIATMWLGIAQIVINVVVFFTTFVFAFQYGLEAGSF